EPIHYQLVKYLVPRLVHLPLEMPWRSQWPPLNYLRFMTTLAYQTMIRPLLPRKLIHWLTSRKPIYDSDYKNNMLTVLEAKGEQIRQVCLDQSASLVWSLVNRSMFERLLSPATEAGVRAEFWVILFQIATVFYYAGSA